MRCDVFSDTSGSGVFFNNTFYGTWTKPAKIARGIGCVLIGGIVEEESG